MLGTRLFGNVVPVATLVFLMLAVVATVALNTTRFGRYVFAVGGNERASRLSGIPVGRVRVAVYGITGFMSAAAGIVHAGQFSFGSPNDGAGYELTAIAAVVIGGTSLFGGAGTMVGTIAGSTCWARSPISSSSTTSARRCSFWRPARSSCSRRCCRPSSAGGTAPRAEPCHDNERNGKNVHQKHVL